MKKIGSSSLQIIGKCFGFFIVVAVSTDWFFSGRDEPQIKSNGVPVYTGDHAPALMVKPVGNSISSQGIANYFEPSSSGSIDNANNIYQLTPQEKSEAEVWFSARGQLGKVNSEYSTYSIDSLEKLVSGGDMEAIFPLGMAYLRRSGMGAANQFFLEMAARGNTNVFLTMGSFLETDRQNTADTATDEEKISADIEILAHYNVAQLRGDRLPNILRANSFIRSNNIHLTDESVQKINARSQEIYNQIQQKRTELGLGEFDNSVPESVNKYFNQFNFLNVKVNH